MRAGVALSVCVWAFASAAMAQMNEPSVASSDTSETLPAPDALPLDESTGEDTATSASQIRALSTSLAAMIREVDERRRGFSITLEGGGSILTPLVDASTRSITFHGSLQAAYHLPDLAFVVSVEGARWRAPELGGRAWQTALNIGFGFARYHRSGLLRTMLLVGPSILTRANDLDPAGSVGLYLDFRPLGFSWRVNERFAIVADLLYMTLVAPVLTGVPLIDFQFRSSLGVEASF